MNDTEAKLLFAVDGMYRRGRVLPLKSSADEALSQTKTIEMVIVVKRVGIQGVQMSKGGDYWLDELMMWAELYCEPKSVKANEPRFIFYTSGIIGRPKGVVHNAS